MISMKSSRHLLTSIGNIDLSNCCKSRPAMISMADDDGSIQQLVLTAGALTDYEDIISEILARLPVKSLMRFRCVSKPWCALIAKPYLVKKHLLYSESCIGCNTSPKLLFSLNPPQSLDYEALKDLDDHGGDAQFARTDLHYPISFPEFSNDKITILGACHGLVCLYVLEKGLVLWNPCTRESSLLPNPPIQHLFPKYEVGDPRSPVYFCGFGYDSTIDDYKCLVAEYPREIGSGYESEVPSHNLTLKTGSWRSGTHNIDVDGNLSGPGLLFKGYLHWYANEYEPCRIMSFNLAQEKFEEIVPSPPPDIVVWGIFKCRNCLCLYAWEEQFGDFSTIWIMEEFGVRESWTQIIRFSRDDQFDMWPLCVLENSEVLMVTGPLVNENGRLMLLNQNTRRAVFVADIWSGNDIYRESLVSPVAASIVDIE